ncbi:MAG: bifunctional phosphopantothenoylcysteine decarboxylase/phosphopantothenate--cysteine ligase CoaBC [Hungatella sp.]|nr:bifunctional phosphopantothenoylcysteine decarboxylase/phosphopantothenate--cysteine ligase CoaBC [Hungatella sp.]
MLNGKTVVLGVSGSIAAYKIAYLASSLKKLHADVQVIMTKNATEFITPVTFESLTGNKCMVDTFDRNFQFSVEHVALAKKADIFVLAPATANVIAKAAHGLADDMLTTTFLACRCPKYIFPAMNTQMYENPITQDNLKRCEAYKIHVVDPSVGYLACGDTGAGKMPEPSVILEYIIHEIGYQKDLEGKKILVTAGPTREALDPVRYLTNHSTGKMGYALAKAAARRGAEVTLVSGPTDLPLPMFMKVLKVESAREMFKAVTSVAWEQDAVIKAAAVADYRPAVVAQEKMKKKDGELTLAMERTDDILGYLGQHKREGQLLCGFSMETQNLVENSRAKLVKKNLDMVAANSLKVEGAGFGTDTNVVTLITGDGELSLDKMSKEQVAHRILTELFFRKRTVLPGKP